MGWDFASERVECSDSEIRWGMMIGVGVVCLSTHLSATDGVLCLHLGFSSYAIQIS